MNDTPLPFTVSAMRTVGWPLVCAASSKAARICVMSCPSMRMTCQPKAAYFRSMGAMSMTSFVQPSICSRFRSTTAQTLSTLKFAADIAASQTLPSCCSPSPIRQYTRRSCPASRIPSAAPTEIPRPWPSEPLETSTPFVFSRCGWPWKVLPKRRKVMISLSL
jgi:hypothetical protein